jgi:DTW domain-containing protein YfiP
VIAEPAAHRAICARCRRPESVCYCAHLVSLPTRTRVLLLQHPRERHVPIGTARLAHLCLPGSELSLGVFLLE